MVELVIGLAQPDQHRRIEPVLRFGPLDADQQHAAAPLYQDIAWLGGAGRRGRRRSRLRKRGAGSRKIAASKKKGMWMGGIPPLGYRAQDGKLLVIESEAEIVRAIFPCYAELGSVRLLKDELEARGIKSKSWTTASGRLIGGKSFSRGAPHLMLQNHLYRGEIVHKAQSHPGEHTPIIDQPLWDAVQTQLATNNAERNSGTRTRQPSLLAGRLFNGDGNRMTPTHATKKGRRYATMSPER